MRLLKKLEAPKELGQAATPQYAAALSKSLDSVCSFCEARLVQPMQVFHTQRGVLPRGASIQTKDWPSLWLICKTCARYGSRFSAKQNYLWPEDLGEQPPYLYLFRERVPIHIKEHSSKDAGVPSVSRVLLKLNPALTGRQLEGARNTLDLFWLNGRGFNGKVDEPAYELTVDEYIFDLDPRMQARVEAYRKGLEMAAALKRAGENRSLPERYSLRLGYMAYSSLLAFGFMSSWSVLFPGNATGST